ncbi:MAG: hypothetical protein R3D71_07805 [Rickettsiales bacterium]
MQILQSIIGIITLAAFLAIAIWFGAAILIFIFISSLLLTAYIILRNYYIRWKYQGDINENFTQRSNNGTSGKKIGEAEGKIVDVEYQDISDDSNSTTTD